MTGRVFFNFFFIRFFSPYLIYLSHPFLPLFFNKCIFTPLNLPFQSQQSIWLAGGGANKYNITWKTKLTVSKFIDSVDNE